MMGQTLSNPEPENLESKMSLTTSKPRNQTQRSIGQTASGASSRRNGLDDDDTSQRKNFGLQTLTDAAVGDCPACLDSSGMSHEVTCPLCRTPPATCGPNKGNCPYASTMPGTPCPTYTKMDDTNYDLCTTTGAECRCIDKACNTDKHCIIFDPQEDPQSGFDSDFDYHGDLQDRPETRQEPKFMSVEEKLIRKCYAVCQTEGEDISADKEVVVYRLKSIEVPRQIRRPPSMKSFNKRKSPRPYQRNGSPASGEETDHYTIIIGESDEFSQYPDASVMRTSLTISNNVAKGYYAAGEGY